MPLHHAGSVGMVFLELGGDVIACLPNSSNISVPFTPRIDAVFKGKVSNEPSLRHIKVSKTGGRLHDVYGIETKICWI